MVSRKLFFSSVVMVIIVFASVKPIVAVDSANPIRVLLLSGMNNHDWQQTTPVLKKIYEDSGRFTVDIINTPLNCNDTIP